MGFSFELSRKQASEHGDEITDEERLQLALAMSLQVNDNNGASDGRLRRSLDSSIEADADSETNAERLQCALAMLMMDKSDDDEIGETPRQRTLRRCRFAMRPPISRRYTHIATVKHTPRYN